MPINEIAFVCYPVSNIERSREFYEKVLKLTPSDMCHEIEGMPGVYWIEYSIGDATFAISNAWEPSGQSGPTVAFEVDDLDQTIAELKAAGVSFQMELMVSPICRFSLINDPDGNAITIHKRNAGHSH